MGTEVPRTLDLRQGNVQAYTVTGFTPVEATVGGPVVTFEITGTNLRQAAQSLAANLVRPAQSFTPPNQTFIVSPTPVIYLAVDSISADGKKVTGSFTPPPTDASNIRKGKYDLQVSIGDKVVILKDAFELK